MTLGIPPEERIARMMKAPVLAEGEYAPDRAGQAEHGSAASDHDHDHDHAAAEGLLVSFHEHRVPSFVETVLERRYGSLFSSIAAMTAYGDDLADTNVFLAKRGAEIATLWLFQKRGKMVRVLNESIRVDKAEASCFADWIFGRFAEVHIIVFNNIDTDIDALARPLQKQGSSEDSVLELPATMDDYLARLGKATRKNINRYTARLREQFPTFEHSVAFRDEIDPARVRELIRLNRVRMNLKGKVAGIEAADERAILNIARRHGMLLTLAIDGRICGGAMLFQFGRHYYSYLRTHDPAYNASRLGLVGACLMIRECIARHGKTLHFMWGREPHKALLLGVEQPLFRLTLYRSRLRLALNLQHAVRNACQGYRRQLSVWLLNKVQRDDDIVARVAAGARRLLRRLRGLQSGRR